jgi:hypothetical protein
MRRLSKYISLKLFLSVIPAFAVPVFAADDTDYLSEISAEVDKVDAVTEYIAEQSGNSDSQAYLENKNGFEKLLEESYHGSYVFYKKLPERAQLEIFDDYRQGQEMSTLREKIIERYMQ